MSDHHDVLVIGGGPAGTTAATLLAQAGVDVAVVECDEFPRFHIGESLTGSAGDIIRELGLADQMTQAEYPEKPGVTVIGRDARNEFFVPVLTPTWQVRRSTFDELMQRNAKIHGVRLIQGRVCAVNMENDRIRSLSYTCGKDQSTREMRCKVVIDASGRHCFLSRQGIAGRKKLEDFSRQIAFFSHYRGVRRDPGGFANNSVIFYSQQQHWAWMIPISPTTDSFGVVVPKEVYRANASTPEEILQWGIKNINPDIEPRLRSAARVESYRACSDYSYAIEPFVGVNWACIGDAHRFLDPIFSFGVSFSMMEARDVARRVAACLPGEDFSASFKAFSNWSNTGQNVAYDLIKYFWKFPAFFGYQMQNAQLREEVIQLFGGACFDPEGMRVPAMFSKELGEDSSQRAGCGNADAQAAFH